MRYSALIHNLIKASEEAMYAKVDVAEWIKERCVIDANIIRQVLMNAVCDPRFKFHVAGIPFWKREAQMYLEAFAERLMSIPNLTSERAFYELNEMLAQWFRKARTISEENDRSELTMVNIPKTPSRHKQMIKRALNDFCNDKESIGASDKKNKEDKEKEKTDKPVLSWHMHKPKPTKKEETHLKNDSENELNIGGGETMIERPRPLSSTPPPRITSNEFMSQVPSSLVRLAKIIGRSSDVPRESNGHFPTASKSDIAGITIGNDLSSLLPTEVAMLSEQTTQPIFLRNYVTRNLQMFASMSQSSNGKKHRNGPVIICLDASGSMQGDKVLVASALTFAVCIIAQVTKRKVLVVRYADYYECIAITNIEKQRKDLLRFVSYDGSGGNNEDAMFRWLFEDILPKQGLFHGADVLCVSDFGWSTITQPVIDIINEQKKSGMMFYGLNIDHDAFGNSQDSQSLNYLLRKKYDEEHPIGTPRDICDSLWEFKNGECLKVAEK